MSDGRLARLVLNFGADLASGMSDDLEDQIRMRLEGSSQASEGDKLAISRRRAAAEKVMPGVADLLRRASTTFRETGVESSGPPAMMGGPFSPLELSARAQHGSRQYELTYTIDGEGFIAREARPMRVGATGMVQSVPEAAQYDPLDGVEAILERVRSDVALAADHLAAKRG